MSEFITTSVTEVARLEEQVKVLQAQLNVHKGAATKWEPQISSVLALEDMSCRITLSYGGSTFSVAMSSDSISNLDQSSATAAYLDKFLSTIVAEKLRPMISTEVTMLKANVKAASAAGKW